MKSFKPNLLHLNPKSVARVFRIVNLFTDLNRKPLKTKEDLKDIFFDYNYCSIEKYFIVTYIKHYLNQDSFIYRQLNEKEILNKKGYNGEIEDLAKWKISTDSYVKKITEACNSYLLEAEILYKNSLQNKIPYDAYETTFDLVAFNSIKIPLKLSFIDKSGKRVTKDFKPPLKEILKGLLNDNDIDILLGNSFGNLQLSPRLLDLNYSSIGAVRSRFFKIYHLYKKEIDTFKDYADSEHKKYWDKKTNNNIKPSQAVRELFTLPDKNLYEKLTNKIHFAQIIFITYRKEREKFIKANLKNKVSVNDYIFENICKNMKKT
ncbi:hypothetical protein ABS768_06835 [Flavobacterium sp. ST-75]|uniref:Uncharacterized protein n=1 Tax=Flavobacterium rhizophilum TaxID=3163296 RepID=A0ABW8YAL6_9FLAO